MTQLTISKLAAMDPKAVDTDNMCDYGWWDWFCADTVCVRFTPRVVAFAKRIKDKFSDTPLFLKNVGGMGSTFHAIILQDKDQNNRYWIDNEDHYWKVIDVNSKETLAKDMGLRELAAFVNTLQVP